MSLAAVLNLLSGLEPGENAYTALRIYLKDQVVPVAPESYRIQLYMFLAMLSIILLATSFSLFMACRKSFWFFHIVHEDNSRSRMPYILPHAATAWLSMAGIFVAGLIGCVSKVIINSKGVMCTDLVEWETLAWIPIFLSGWLAMWSITTSYIIQQVRNDTIKSPLVLFFYSPVFINAVALLIPIGYVSSAIALSLQASKHYRNALQIYLEMDVQLAAGEKLINQGGNFSLLDLGDVTKLQVGLFEEFQIFTTWFGRFYITQSAFALFLICVLITFAFLTLRSLREAIDVSNKVRAEIAFLHKDSDLDGFTGEDPYSLIEKTYYKMFVTIVALLIIGVAQSASAINVAVSYQFLLSSPSAIRTDILIALYLFALPVLPLNILLVIRSFDSTPGVPSISSQFSFPRRWLGSSSSTGSMKTLVNSRGSRSSERESKEGKNESFKEKESLSKIPSDTSELDYVIKEDLHHVVELKVFLEGSRIPLEV